jgi:hypothetical protein
LIIPDCYRAEALVDFIHGIHDHMLLWVKSKYVDDLIEKVAQTDIMNILFLVNPSPPF